MEQPKNCNNCDHYQDWLEFCDTCTATSKDGVLISGPTNWSPKQKDKPTICIILGVEVGERFTIHGMDAVFWIAPDGIFRTDPPNAVGSSFSILYALENPALVHRFPNLEGDELALCRQLRSGGARYLARGKHLRWYTKKPFLCDDDLKWHMNGDLSKHSGKLPPDLFQWIKPGQSFSLDELINTNKKGP